MHVVVYTDPSAVASHDLMMERPIGSSFCTGFPISNSSPMTCAAVSMFAHSMLNSHGKTKGYIAGNSPMTVALMALGRYCFSSLLRVASLAGLYVSRRSNSAGTTRSCARVSPGRIYRAGFVIFVPFEVDLCNFGYLHCSLASYFQSIAIERSYPVGT